MMDLKKIKPKDVLGFLDDLVAKIPESISSLLTKVMIGLLVFSIIYAIYFGYQRGYGSAEQEGQQLAKDTKSLFLEDIEREYNRKRKNIRMPSSDSLMDDDIYKTRKQYEPYGRNSEPQDVIPTEDSPLEQNHPIRNKRTGSTHPLAELETNPTPQEPIIQSEKQREESKPKRKLPLKDNFDSPLYQADQQDLNSAIDRVTNDSEFENKVLQKRTNKKSNLEQNPLIQDESKVPNKEKDIPSDRKEKKSKLIPLDGNE